jgi:hypothetical protein
MRKTAILGLLAAAALGQGRQTRDGLLLHGTAGPAFVQVEFFESLRARLERAFGLRRTADMFEHLGAAGLDARDVLALMNGTETAGDRRDLFGSRDARIREAIDDTVADKDRKLLFGVLVRTMVEKGEDPSSDFCQVGRSRDALSADQFDRLCRGEVSTSFMQECFGLRKKADQQLMQQYLNVAWESPYLLHPLGASLAKRKKLEGTYDPAKFPKPRDGMPGYGHEFKDGRAAGLPFDTTLPPLPFYGKNLEDYFTAK